MDRALNGSARVIVADIDSRGDVQGGDPGFTEALVKRGLFLPLADRIELTEVHASPEGDTVMPPFDPAQWRELGREAHPARDGQPAFSFVTLGRS